MTLLSLLLKKRKPDPNSPEGWLANNCDKGVYAPTGEKENFGFPCYVLSFDPIERIYIIPLGDKVRVVCRRDAKIVAVDRMIPGGSKWHNALREALQFVIGYVAGRKACDCESYGKYVKPTEI